MVKVRDARWEQAELRTLRRFRARVAVIAVRIENGDYPDNAAIAAQLRVLLRGTE